ncbi:MAG: hypothetical protein ACKOC5_09440 [Chloroflexota bacterium]
MCAIDGLDPQGVSERIFHALDEFQQGSTQYDDQAALVVQVCA